MPEVNSSGRWNPALDDPAIEDPSAVKKVLLVSGKLRWELVDHRAKLGLDSEVAIIALERLYPLPDETLADVMERYGHVEDIRFVQDEPENQGAWPFLSVHLPPAMEEITGKPFRMRRVSRQWASAPSVGSIKAHKVQHGELMNEAFGD